MRVDDVIEPDEIVRMCLTCARRECPFGTCQRVERRLRELHAEERRAVRAREPRRLSGRRGKPVLIVHDGVRRPLMDWARELGISYSTLYNRMRRGESFETAIKRGARDNGRRS